MHRYTLDLSSQPASVPWTAMHTLHPCGRFAVQQVLAALPGCRDAVASHPVGAVLPCACVLVAPLPKPEGCLLPALTVLLVAQCSSHASKLSGGARFCANFLTSKRSSAIPCRSICKPPPEVRVKLPVLLRTIWATQTGIAAHPLAAPPPTATFSCTPAHTAASVPALLAGG